MNRRRSPSPVRAAVQPMTGQEAGCVSIPSGSRPPAAARRSLLLLTSAPSGTPRAFRGSACANCARSTGSSASPKRAALTHRAGGRRLPGLRPGRPFDPAARRPAHRLPPAATRGHAGARHGAAAIRAKRPRSRISDRSSREVRDDTLMAPYRDLPGLNEMPLEELRLQARLRLRRSGAVGQLGPEGVEAALALEAQRD
jgi:hypothetical protein